MSPALREAVGGREGLARLSQTIAAQAGREAALVSETVYAGPGPTEYDRVSRFTQVPDTLTLTTRWVWFNQDTIVGATIGPTPRPAPSQYLDYQTKASLRLPFGSVPGGRWYVLWGGRSTQENYHAAAPDQRFAYDIVAVKDGSTHRGEGRYNEDYYCFGRPLLAPAGGVVVTARDSVPDNEPGVMNPSAPPGNYVVIDHGNREHSLLAHFRRGSIRVAQGDTVSRGDTLGLCGNSGNSSEPHVHYHLQTGRRFGEGAGLPAPFEAYLANGKTVGRGELVRGMWLEPNR